MSATNELRFDSGRLCLDLLATVGGRLSTAPVERLDNAARLTEWLRRSGLVPPGQPLPVDDEWLTDFRSLRTRLHRVVHAELRGERADAADIGRLNGIAAAGPPASALRRDDDGVLHRCLTAPVRREQLAAAVADDAVRLLTSPDRAALRECDGPTCDLVYLDTSRGRRRRWCSAAACGNRHYVATHRARHPNSTGGTGSTGR